MKYMEDLKQPNRLDVENLLSELQQFFRKLGIIMPRRVDTKENSAEDVQKSQWIKHFIIPTDEKAFYLQIDSPDDIKELNHKLADSLQSLQKSLKDFQNKNENLEESLRKKIQSFISILSNAIKKLTRGALKTELKKASETCNAVKQLREESGRLYAKFIKDDLLDNIMYPSYEGLRHDPNEEVYLFVVETMNQFLANLGVMTIQVNEGDRLNDDLPYKISEETKAEQYKTTNEQEQDIIKAVLRYAYVFQENKGGDNRQIADGEVIVMVFEPEGV